MSTVALVYAVYPDGTAARAAVDLAITQGLAACANILAPCRSVYRWEGKIEDTEEVPVLFKTSALQRPALVATLAEAHPYDIPAIIGWDSAAAHPPFVAWVEGETGGSVA